MKNNGLSAVSVSGISIFADSQKIQRCTWGKSASICLVLMFLSPNIRCENVLQPEMEYVIKQTLGLIHSGYFYVLNTAQYLASHSKDHFN